MRAHGAKAVLHGDAFPEALAHALKLVDEKGYTFVHPYDDPDTIAGQGTVAMEILRQQPGRLDAIFVPVGGGGLVAGIAAYVEYLRPEIKVIGVEPDESNCLQAAMAAGERVVLGQVGLFADGVAVAQIGQHTFDICKDHVDEVITVSTDEICAAIRTSTTTPARSPSRPARWRWPGSRSTSSASAPRGRPWWRSTPAPTSTSIACGMSPNAPNWASAAKRSSR